MRIEAARKAEVASSPGTPAARGALVRSTHADLARAGLSPGGDVRRRRDELRALLGGRRARELCLFDDGGRRAWTFQRRPPCAGTATCRMSARASDTASACTVPGRPSTATGATRQAPAGPLREGRRRGMGLARSDVPVPLRAGVLAQRSRQRAARAQRRRGQPVLRLGARPSPGNALAQEHRLRDAREGVHDAVPGRARGTARHLRGDGAPGRGEVPPGTGRHRGRTAAGAPVRAGLDAGRSRPAQLLGLQLDRLPGAAQRVPRGAAARRPGAGVQAPRQDAASGGHRGDPRRGLQPHGRGEPPRAVSCRSRGSTTRRTTA
jgi:hypothetical protein